VVENEKEGREMGWLVKYTIIVAVITSSPDHHPYPYHDKWVTDATDG
jgi:hypothetical protein